MLWPAVKGPAVIRVVTSDTSTDVAEPTATRYSFESTPSTVAVAVFVTTPAATSPARTVYVAEQVIDSPGSRKLSRSPTVVTAGQVTVALSSATVTGPCNGANPPFVTR